MTENVVIKLKLGNARGKEKTKENILYVYSENMLDKCPALKSLKDFTSFLQHKTSQTTQEVEFLHEYFFEEKACELFEDYINHGLVFIEAASKYGINYRFVYLIISLASPKSSKNSVNIVIRHFEKMLESLSIKTKDENYEREKAYSYLNVFKEFRDSL
jgi:hypothetical protein